MNQQKSRGGNHGKYGDKRPLDNTAPRRPRQLQTELSLVQAALSRALARRNHLHIKTFRPLAAAISADVARWVNE